MKSSTGMAKTSAEIKINPETTIKIIMSSWRGMASYLHRARNANRQRASKNIRVVANHNSVTNWSPNFMMG